MSEKAMSRGAFWLLMKRIAVIAGGVDFFYLLIFSWLDFPVIAALNIVSASAYGLAYYCLSIRRNKLAMALMWTEVLLHAGLCTIIFGWNTGIHYFLLVFLPALSVGRSTRDAVLAILVLLGAYIGLDALTLAIPIQAALPPHMVITLRWINISVVFLMMGYTGRYFFARVAEAEHRLQMLATTDPLTGLLNRRHFLDQAISLQQRAQIDESDTTLAIVDIDHFKKVNDSLGHNAGDVVIRSIAKSLSDGLRPTDLVGRWGGEEFIALFPDTSECDAFNVCDRVRTTISDTPVMIDERAVKVSISIGVVKLKKGAQLSSGVKAADDALYLAKREGRNQVRRLEIKV